jgi:serine O-acetyltransferase
MAADPRRALQLAPGASEPAPEPEAAEQGAEDVLEEVAEALSRCDEDALSQAACGGIPDGAEVVDWLERARRLVLYQRDRSALRSELRALAERLRALLLQVIAPDAGLDPDEIVGRFASRLPAVRGALAEDVEAAMRGDPAAKSYEEIVLAYPAIRAIATYRIAHELHRLGVPLLPRIMTEHGHDRTGIDIHPGARIGRRFFIDHGTGVVVGETAVIGDGVKLYQGVTLGALSTRHVESKRGVKRHPTLEDEVTVYAGATILGGETVIGAGSVIGGNVWLTESVPPCSKVVAEPPRQLVEERCREERDAESCAMQLHWDI